MKELIKETENFNYDKVIERLEEWKSRTDVPSLGMELKMEDYYGPCAYCHSELEKNQGLILRCGHFIGRDCLIRSMCYSVNKEQKFDQTICPICKNYPLNEVMETNIANVELLRKCFKCQFPVKKSYRHKCHEYICDSCFIK